MSGNTSLHPPSRPFVAQRRNLRACSSRPLQTGEQQCTVPGMASERRPSGLVRDASEEFLSRMDRSPFALKLPGGAYDIEGPDGTRLTGAEVAEASAGLAQTDDRRLALQHRFDAYLLLRTFVESGELEEAMPDGGGVYVSLEGNIGVGKTTLCKQLHDLVQESLDGVGDRVAYIEEKVQPDWLNAFLADSTGMATLFQFERLFATINAAKTMGTAMQAHAAHGTRLHCIGDRLPLGNVPFAVMHYAEGNIPRDLFLLYGATISAGGPFLYPDVLYLHCPVPIVKARIARRNRPGEAAAYTDEYLETLDETSLFVMLYMWYTDVVNVTFLDWRAYQAPVEAIEAMKLNRTFRGPDAEAPADDQILVQQARKLIRTRLLTMSYAEMKWLATLLAWTNGRRGVHAGSVWGDVLPVLEPAPQPSVYVDDMRVLADAVVSTSE